ncbi:hypothetical protein B0T11DRAFT_57852 [Plectosphaerella cucumerina]|uniref:Uncharacterized protein n=1 Tax=Plectosphaerella cucumerina TaxID=40658 RepID=A0A8K0TNG6_9PEZI|nr:hypothetical protein B0T11DRAFT_57852 [Plectosphaerella cucumerina]
MKSVLQSGHLDVHVTGIPLSYSRATGSGAHPLSAPTSMYTRPSHGRRKKKHRSIESSPRQSCSLRTKHQKTYNTGYSLVVTDPTTNPALTGLSMGERTGSRVFQ